MNELYISLVSDEQQWGLVGNCSSHWHPPITMLTQIQVHFTDNWPSSAALWLAILPETIGRLGVFHWMHRIIETLHANHQDIHRACSEMSEAVFAVGVVYYFMNITSIKTFNHEYILFFNMLCFPTDVG
jgi:hypothetical protein